MTPVTAKLRAFLFTLAPGEKRLVSDVARRDPEGFISAVKQLMDSDPEIYRTFEFQKHYTVIRRLEGFPPPPPPTISSMKKCSCTPALTSQRGRSP